MSAVAHCMRRPAAIRTRTPRAAVHAALARRVARSAAAREGEPPPRRRDRALSWLCTGLGAFVCMLALPVAVGALVFVLGGPRIADDPLEPGPARMSGYTDSRPCRSSTGGTCRVDPAAVGVHQPPTGPLAVDGG